MELCCGLNFVGGNSGWLDSVGNNSVCGTLLAGTRLVDFCWRELSLWSVVGNNSVGRLFVGWNSCGAFFLLAGTQFVEFCWR